MTKERQLLLWLSPEPPAKYSGGSLTILHFLREVGKYYDIHFLCLPSNLHGGVSSVNTLDGVTVLREYRRDQENKLGPLVVSLATRKPYKVVKNRSRALDKAVGELLSFNSYAAAIVEHSYMAEHAIGMRLPRVLNMHNIESDLSSTEGRYAASPVMRRIWSGQTGFWRDWDSRMVATYDHVTVTSENDRQRLLATVEEVCAEKCFVLPRGVSCIAQASEARSSGSRMLFVGSMSYGPNIDASVYFCRSVLSLIRQKIPDAVITIVGGNPAEEVSALSSIPGVTVTGWVEDVQRHYQQADLVVIPMRSGGGVKMKLLEAMGMGMPIVTTTAGAEGIGVRNGVQVMIADESVAFAQTCADLLRDGTKREQLGKNALGFVKEHHSWENTGRQLVKAIENAQRNYWVHRTPKT